MTPEEVQIIVQSVLHDGFAFPWWAYVVPSVIAFAGAYLGSYMKRKAENLATKEDFDDLLVQVKRTTAETENIKAEISRVSWVDQQRWNLKRELYLELLDSIYSEKEALFKLADEQTRPTPTEVGILELREKFISENRQQSLSAIKRITKVRGVAGVLLTDEAQQALDELALAWYRTIDGDPDDFYTDRRNAADKAYKIVLANATRDLDVKPGA